MKNILSINDLSKKEILDLIFLAEKIKKSPQNYNSKLKNKVLLDIFEKPSLRTRLSFEVAVYQLGGHTIFYDLGNSPLGKGKESIEDTARVISKYVNVVMARLYSQEDLISLAENGNIPVINGLTDYEHPCQILGDLLTIKEKLRRLSNIKIAYFGDAKNNVTHSLMFACSKLGIKMSVACPRNMQPLFRINGVEVTQDVNKAIKNADIVYVDSWMSYQISKSKHAKRVKQLRKYQVNVNLMKKSPKALFMHCLPAKRGEEVTSEVMDSNKSIVFDQAENRLHIQKAILLKLLC
ncbi:ornithine carbamoyltransferase [Candidatus Woesearchaeota archaeon]|nr:ornithine carbamoyltransferase [Candidatus Woesearchaeota archaeon]